MGAAPGRFSLVPELRSRHLVLGSLRRLLEEPYRTYLIPGICYGFEDHVRLGFGPGTAARIRAGLKQIDRFIADYRAGKVAV